jgi:hypothetical protein
MHLCVEMFRHPPQRYDSPTMVCLLTELVCVRYTTHSIHVSRGQIPRTSPSPWRRSGNLVPSSIQAFDGPMHHRALEDNLRLCPDDNIYIKRHHGENKDSQTAQEVAQRLLTMQGQTCKSTYLPTLSTFGQNAADTILKCDEQKPDCANCVKQGTVCEYRPRSNREASNLNLPLPAAGNPFSTHSAAGTPMSSGDGMVFDQTISDFNAIPTNGAPGGPDTTVNITQMRLLQYVFPLFLRYS